MEDEIKTPSDDGQTIADENVSTLPTPPTAAQLAFEAGDYAGARKLLINAPQEAESPFLQGALRWDPILLATPTVLFLGWLVIVFSL